MSLAEPSLAPECPESSIGCKFEKPSAARKMSGGGAGARCGSADDNSSRDCCCNIQYETSESESCQPCAAAIERYDSEDEGNEEPWADEEPVRKF